jgi:hypothetical protein
MRRNELLAYLIAAGVAGTLLVLPYTGAWIIPSVLPQFEVLRIIPFFLLPIAWGVWNWLYYRVRAGMGIGVWGAILGLLLAVGVNLLRYAHGQWFAGMVLFALVIPVLYYVLWLFVIGPLNDAFGLER